MNSKQTVNKIFSKLNEKTNLATQKVELSLATDIDGAYKKTLGIEADLDFAATEYKDDAMKQTILFEDMMDSDIRLLKAQSEYEEANDEFEIGGQKVTSSEALYKNAIKDASQALKELSRLEQKAVKATKELGIPEQTFIPLVTAVTGQQDLQSAINQAKSKTSGIK